ncbi:hypothetical protein SprV_0301038800 [Sparganum proliferum]
MVSFDVTSLFTFIPPNLAREVLRKRLEEAYDETQNTLKIEHLMRLFEFCQHTSFTFARETYEQIKGTPMGSPVSGLVTELVLQEFETTVFIQHEPVFWRRYVDDTYAIVKKGMLQHFHSLLNAVFPDIKFPREGEQEQQLPFLDVLVRRNLSGELETTVSPFLFWIPVESDFSPLKQLSQICRALQKLPRSRSELWWHAQVRVHA